MKLLNFDSDWDTFASENKFLSHIFIIPNNSLSQQFIITLNLNWVAIHNYMWKQRNAQNKYALVPENTNIWFPCNHNSQQLRFSIKKFQDRLDFLIIPKKKSITSRRTSLVSYSNYNQNPSNKVIEKDNAKTTKHLN